MASQKLSFGGTPGADARGTLWKGREGPPGRLVGAGLLSAGLYAALYLTQRAIYFNGLGQGFMGLGAGEHPANASLLMWQGLGYVAAIVALFALYYWLLRLCRDGRRRHPTARRAALVFPLLFHLAFLFGRPYLSIDLFSYMAHGYLGTLPGSNPYARPAFEAADTPFGPELMAAGWWPVHPISPYGPLWTTLEMAVMSVTESVGGAMLLF